MVLMPSYTSVALQWGHRLSAVETGEVIADAPPLDPELQWGHRLSAVETWPLLNVQSLLGH